MSYVVAFYEIDLAYGGPQEGGWHYATGELARPLKVCRTEAQANKVTQRANSLLDRIQREKRPVESVLYTGGRYRACAFKQTAPVFFPAVRPHYH